MAIIINGTTVQNVVYNGISLDRVVYNGVLVWESAFVFNHTISGNMANFSLQEFLWAEGWDGVKRVIGILTIAAGAEVYSSLATQPALLIEALPNNPDLELVNLGTIIGAGGKGGNVIGEGMETSPEQGQTGGTALEVRSPIRFSNGAQVLGGGGGGGGGFTGIITKGEYAGSLYGGGGGQGQNGGPGGSVSGTGNHLLGSPGTRTAPGVGGKVTNVQGHGGDGGGLGEPGQPGWFWLTDEGAIDEYFIPGGVSGYAILGESNITWLSGNTSTQIKGRRE